MGDELSERAEALERDARRLRRWVLVLGAVLVGAVAVGASVPQEMTLRKLTIVDDDGRRRIVAGSESGIAYLHHYDVDGRVRIGATTYTTGLAKLAHYGPIGGRVRIVGSTDADGEAVLSVSDSRGNAEFSKTTN